MMLGFDEEIDFVNDLSLRLHEDIRDSLTLSDLDVEVLHKIYSLHMEMKVIEQCFYLGKKKM